MTKDPILILIETLQSASGIFLGVGFAVFTLVYAFVQNKKDALKDVDELLKREGDSITLLRKKNSCIKFISKMRKISIDSIVLVVFSCIGLIISYILAFINYVSLVCELIIKGSVIVILFIITVYAIKIALKLFIRSEK